MPNDSITLRIDDKTDVVLPSFVATSTLPLAEIGALFCFAATVAEGVDLTHPRFQTPEMIEAAQRLRERGIFSAGVEGSTVKLAFDLDRLPQ